MTKYLSRKKRKVINPRDIKKHSDIVKKQVNTGFVFGDKIETKTGFITTGFSNKNFKTYFQFLDIQNVTDLVMHDKKTKVINVLSGSGFVIFVENPTEAKENWKGTEHRLIPGDTVELGAGRAYSIATTANNTLLFSVVEDSKYDARVVVIEESDTRSVSNFDSMFSLDRDEVIEQYKPIVRQGSKAKEQLLAIAKKRKRNTVRVSAEELPNVEPLLNVKPTLGQGFDPATDG